MPLTRNGDVSGIRHQRWRARLRVPEFTLYRDSVRGQGYGSVSGNEMAKCGTPNLYNTAMSLKAIALEQKDIAHSR